MRRFLLLVRRRVWYLKLRIQTYLRQHRPLPLKDFLTGLPSRRAWLATDFRPHVYRCHVSLVNVDNLKNYMDFYGLTEGDEAIKMVSALTRLHSSVRTMPSSIYRTHGNKLLIVWRTQHWSQIAQRLEQLRAGVELNQPGLSASVTVTIATTRRLPSETAADMLERLEALLGDAKERGRNHVFVYPPMDF
jgi:diguanylate cyclase (GGDEF)-like protein